MKSLVEYIKESQQSISFIKKIKLNQFIDGLKELDEDILEHIVDQYELVEDGNRGTINKAKYENAIDEYVELEKEVNLRFESVDMYSHPSISVRSLTKEFPFFIEFGKKEDGVWDYGDMKWDDLVKYIKSLK